MTDHTPAAQPGQDDITARLRENADLDAAEDGNPAVIRMEREAADEIDKLRALLSKLRAPVADIPRAVFALEHIAAWAGTGPGLKTHKEVRAYAKHNAALASAPVAGEAQKPVAWLRETTPGGGVWHRSVSLDEPPTGFPAIDRKTPLYAAPQASPEPVGMVLDERRDTYRLAVVAPGMRPGDSVYAAPQASEAVRQPDYTLQHADHMAVSAERLMEAINARDALIMQREESDDVDDETMHDQHENVSEYLSGMRNAIYEYRKRRNRAALSAQPGAQYHLDGRPTEPDNGGPVIKPEGK